MARGRLYTQEEDAIILQEASSEAVNERFRDLGLEERSDFSIRKRRSDLRRRRSESPAFAAAERDKVLRELAALERRKHALYDRLTQSTIAVVAHALGVDPDDLPPTVVKDVQEQAKKLTGNGQLPEV